MDHCCICRNFYRKKKKKKVSACLMDYEGLIDDNRVLISLIACSMNYETAVTFTYGHFNKVVFAVQ